MAKPKPERKHQAPPYPSAWPARYRARVAPLHRANLRVPFPRVNVSQSTVSATRRKNRATSKPSGRVSTRRRERIALNGQYLDEIRTRLHSPTAHGSASYLCLPKEHHRVIPDGEGFVLRVPAITTLQLHP